MLKPDRARKNAVAAATPLRFRRMNFAARYSRVSGLAITGIPLKWRRTSAASCSADSGFPRA